MSLSQKTILFQEKQRFRILWIWIVMICVDALLFYGIYLQLIVGQHFGTKPVNNTGLVLITLLALTLTIFFLLARLETCVASDGIMFRFFPFHLKFKFYSWEDILKCTILTYHPLKDYGGWGLRYSFRNKSKAFTVFGNRGLKLELKKGSQILIGTQEEDKMKSILLKIPGVRFSHTDHLAR